ncbi:MAG: Gx transporter family protein [Lachnospiraceae bacterium]|nr:Gx transporter family protein [Lachnospiraceae bacterium]
MKRPSAHNLTLPALYSAASLAIYGFESLLPLPVPIPGFRLGLSNVVVLAVLRRYGSKAAAMVLAVRILLSAILFGSPVSLLYALAGGTLCLLSEILLEALFHRHFLPLISLWGGTVHNLGQLLIALLLLGRGALLYLPYLILMGAGTGLFTGLAAHFFLRKLPALQYRPHEGA